MSSLVITGGQKLKGEIRVEGSKNAVLPILAATVLNGGLNVIKNCPGLKDVEIMIEILREIGCVVSKEGSTIIVDSSSVNSTIVPEAYAIEMRSSIIFLGPILSRFGKATIGHPGGCDIGPRPIDLHLKALKKMGTKIQDAQRGFIYCEADKLKGCDIQLDYPSVGATENIMLAAVFAEGDTYIRNAAKEPEIVDLQNFLIGLGVNISGAGTSVVHIEGAANKKLKNIEHVIISDRITAGTYMVAAAMTGGDVTLKGIVPEHISATVSSLREAGCRINVKRNELHISGPARPKAIDIIRTLPYPGFPTDMQAQIVTMLAIARGTSIVVETVFENRFMYVEELLRMGANIKLEGRIAVIKGVKKLTGAQVAARDLRGGAALVLAGLAAEGVTTVSSIKHIDRGYENIEEKLAQLGALIRREV
ncbi:MAG: UDP-N-acetylglucosamine 1-carboxyvinyltransferase [Clostridia bacterium]|nr:UDP-N-acetylglucosamine 1-carboxyvinyltransferase [Clostridia bacterium]